MQVALRNEITGRIKLFAIGWSWTLFLFGPLYGIPLFIRGVPKLGIAVATINGAGMLVFAYSGEPTIQLSALIAILALAILLAANGNRLTAVHYLERNWLFAEPDTEATKIARATWKLDDIIGTPRVLSPEEKTRVLIADAAAAQRDNMLTIVGVLLIIAIVVAGMMGGDAVSAFFAPSDQPG